MNSPLTEDVTQAYYLVDTAILLKIENIVATHLAPAHQRLYLQLEQQKNSTWFTVYTSLLWARLQHNSEFHLTDKCLGQKLKICYLPQSQTILQLFSQQNLQQDLAYSKVLQHLYQPLPSEKIKHIPSQLQYAFLSSQSIKVEPTSIHRQQFDLQITAAQQKQVNISSTESHFDLFYSVLQQHYKLPDLCKIQQQISTSSKIMTLYDLSKQPKNIRWVLFTLSGIFFILSILHTVFIFFAIFMFIAALITKFIISRFDYLKILEND